MTGGAGFIGSHVADAYLARGWAVTIVDNLVTGKVENVPAGAEFVQLDVRDDGIQELFESHGGFDVVNHHAAQMDVRLSVQDPKYDADVNVRGLLNVLEAARQWKTRRVVFISSGGVIYGESGERPISESAGKGPESPYGVTKLVGEYYLRCFRLLHGLDYVALRYSNVYGPRQDPHGEAGVVAIFSKLIIANQPITIFGSGEQTRDYVFVEDVVAANMLVSDADLGDGRGIDDRAFNVGTGSETSVNQLAQELMGAAGRDVPVKYAAERPGELEWNCLQTTRLRELGWEPETSLSDGLERTYRWIAERAE